MTVPTFASILGNIKSAFGGLTSAYRDTFEGPQGERVMADLYFICCMGESTYRGDDTAMKINEGKRQVYLHILSMCRADEEELGRLAHQQALEIFRQHEDFTGSQ
jgi:hypothetical protein